MFRHCIEYQQYVIKEGTKCEMVSYLAKLMRADGMMNDEQSDEEGQEMDRK
jgi:hypothetical protein